MHCSARLSLLFCLACAALWVFPACSAGHAGQASPAARAAPRHQQDTPAVAPSLRAGLSALWTHRDVLEAATEPPLSDSPGQESAKGSNSVPPAERQAALARARAAPPLACDILLLIQRQNE